MSKSIPEPILWFLLRNKRPHGSQAIETAMLEIQRLCPSAFRDGGNNLWVDLRTEQANTTMFQAHLDTVHHEEGPIKIFMGTDSIVDTNGKDVLGADDGAGVALLTSLMLANVPALYLFSQKEESGGDGGKYAVANMTHLVTDIQRVIAFDRKGKFDICGEQFCGTLASRTFVAELSKRLSMKHSWACGSYTDNSEWQGLIPEIVNVSVGYEANHTADESFDYGYWCRLREACLRLDWESLPTEGPDTSADYAGTDLYGYHGQGSSLRYDDPPEDEFWDYVDLTGMDPNSHEGQLLREAFERVFEAGLAAGSPKPKTLRHV